MIKPQIIGNNQGGEQSSEEDFIKAAAYTKMINRRISYVYSLYALAVHIVLIVEVFNHQQIPSQVCSIASSGLLIIQHFYHGTIITILNLYLTLPLCGVGYFLSKMEVANTLAFLFQICLWLGEQLHIILQYNTDNLMKKRPVVQQSTYDQNGEQLIIKADGQQSNKPQRETTKEINDLGETLSIGTRQINNKQKDEHQDERQQNLVD
ncbi:unnamed protein product (macronuclear) [Paramecium tetraurelia]|uniref:Transmembrane protein n=1 Tax=Paramecium tetraurelia TaxID=5888 RepID=A0BTC9_PARTE|nr:uncharacterized protein GSPATT00032028001 [Paramecium tetraurelia]CAK61796.1 unnamed protein product [Paramecium tetraurelia]|eukprot:XP_001429194.1 hypothetical protein (macronuclear) [Paramecium tetraurelia strain d4-2]